MTKTKFYTIIIILENIDTELVNYIYDSLNRPETKTLSGGTASISESYTYLSAGTNKTTPLVSKITYSDNSYLQYSYNAVNNITAVFDENSKSTTYAYDGLGQIVRENNPYSNATYTYAYDKGGNITSVKTYAYTTGTLGTATSTVTYTYGDSAWKDKLTKFNTTAITYDSIGNPLSYRNGTLTWNGRQLASYTNSSGSTTSYTYDVNGVRIGKSGAKNISYVVSGTQILSETSGSTTTYYIYDEKGLPIGIVYNGTTYTYRKNLQGDIIAILNSAGTEVVTYTYNAWGRIINMGGSAVATVGQANPFRYRGYYYDSETGYYYLNSRYYDPTTGRFLNADGFVSTGQGLLGTNMYAYCGNNPVMRVDPNGMLFVEALILYGIFSGDIFGAGATSVMVIEDKNREYVPTVINSFITVKTGAYTSEILSSTGDSSKPISVYAEERVDSPLESSAGLKFNLFGCSLDVSIGFGRTGVGLSVPNGEETQTHFLGADLAEFKLGYEVSVTKPIISDNINKESTAFASTGVTGRGIAALIMAYYSGTPGPFLQPIPTR